ncbi:hypothetical protein [Nocardioides bruguierae]|uniref:hypothetical protein n=1 Tax=Nocardioides bruguierae TaxID=2945102 RepID=UPI00202097B6|nr:hypothetical protein [Nocardioides bruguierae]MCL8026078.1 hypothetical protein [Nocardioides bruguierae]
MTESPTPRQPARKAILSRHRSSIDAWLSNEGAEALDGDAFETEANRARLAGLRELDPQASLHEELRVRLVASTLAQGALTFDVGSALLKPLQESVASLADDQVELELTGVSVGSTVLHVRPRHTVHSESDEDPAVGDQPIDSTSTEAALRAFVDLAGAAEREEDLRRWLKAADAFGRFSKALDKIDAQVDVAFSGVSGEVRSAWFGNRGRDYVRRILETTPQPQTTIISGRVVELRESGIVKVKTGIQRNSPAYDVRVDPPDLIDMHLELGQGVTFVVRIVQQVDGLGQAQSVEVLFVSTADGFSTADIPLEVATDEDE